MKLITLHRIILTGIILIGITSCDPCKRLNKLCKPEVRDSIVYIEKVKLDTLRLVLPGDTTILEVPVDLTDYSLAQENSKQKIQLDILKVKLRLITICKDDSLQVVIKNLEKKLSEQKTVIVEKPVPVYKCRKFFIYCTIALFVIIAVSIGWTFLKYKAKILSLIK
jgi:hypothetical protein